LEEAGFRPESCNYHCDYNTWKGFITTCTYLRFHDGGGGDDDDVDND